jgi:hypothetical protein
VKRLAAWLASALVLFLAGGSIALRFFDREPEVNLDPRSVQIQVVNGSGEERLGRAVAEELELRGFNIYGTANADSLHSRTTIIDLLDRDAVRARKMATLLSVKPRFWRIPLGPRRAMRVRAAVDSSRYIDLRLVLGKDCRRFFPKVLVFR